MRETDSILETLGEFGVSFEHETDQTLGFHADRGELNTLPNLRLLDSDAEPHQDALWLKQTLGEGGMGTVHLAVQPSLEREVAVKVLRERDTAMARQLVFEARITGRIEHPNVVPIHALGVDAERGPVVVMKRVQGESWASKLDAEPVGQEGRPMDALLGHLDILMQVCNAVHFAHSRGVIHRDLKPENVMVGSFGEVYVVDWGVALELELREAEPRGLVGTPVYLAPEMLSGDPSEVDARTDVYLLGALLHELLTGRSRHEAGSLVQALSRAQSSEPARYPESVPTRLAAIANRACCREPEGRFQSAAELRDALAAFLDSRHVEGLIVTLGDRVSALEALVTAAPSETGKEALGEHDSRVSQLYEQLRFGLEQLQESGARDDERADLERRAHNALLRHEIARDNLLGARRQVRELGDGVEPELRSAFDAMEREEEARLEELARRRAALDPSVSRRQRLIIGGGVLVLMVGVTVQGVLQRGLQDPEPARLVVIAAVASGLLLLGGLLWRRRILANELNRTYYRMYLMVGMSMLVSRVVGLQAGVEPASIARQDMLLIAVVLLSARLPSRIPTLVGVATLGAVLTTVWFAGYVHLAFQLVTILGGGAVVLDSIGRRPSGEGGSSAIA